MKRLMICAVLLLTSLGTARAREWWGWHRQDTATPAASASPATATATSTLRQPTATPTPVIRASAQPTATPGSSSSAAAVTSTPAPASFYVSPNGSDSNPGTQTAPWRTVQHAADTLSAGETAEVMPGSYNETLSISRSGTSGHPITIESGTVTQPSVAGSAPSVLGGSIASVTITGSYVTLSGFDISNQTNGNSGYGVYVTGNASHDSISGNWIHELCREGIYLDPGVSNITIEQNQIWHAEMAGINIDGVDDIVSGNEVWGTSEYPGRLGGIYANCSQRSGADADALRFFGPGHLVQGNFFHDIAFGTIDNPNPHTDCWQTWGESGHATTGVVFNANYCRWPNTMHAGSAGEEVCEMEAIDGAVGNITITNNILADMFQGVQIGAGVGPVLVLNNTLDHIIQEGVIYQDTRTSADQIVNNIFYDVGDGNDPFATSTDPTIERNDFVMRSGSTGGGAPAGTLSLPPDFVSGGDWTGLGADYELAPNSPLIGAGATVPGVTGDYLGIARLPGSFSVGAYQE